MLVTHYHIKMEKEQQHNNNSTEKKMVVNITKTEDFTYWCDMLECKKEDLIAAITSVGNSYNCINYFLEMNKKKIT